jgi:hypothetical protein
MNNGPTLNPRYNAVLARWAKGGHDATPACEECSKCLKGAQVYDIGMWACEECAAPWYEGQGLELGESLEGEVRAEGGREERRQMGITY